MEQLSGSSDADASVLNWNLLQTVSIIFCSLISVKLLCNLIFLVSIPSFCVGYINYSDKEFSSGNDRLESVTALYERYFWHKVLKIVLDSDSSEM